MQGSLLKSSLVAAALLVGGQLNLAQAAVATPAGAASLSEAANSVETVRWVCGPNRCAWRPDYWFGVVPPYARAWGPPASPWCTWVRRPRGWVHVC